MSATFNPKARKALRRAVRAECQAVGLREFDLVGERLLDLSPRGMLLASDRPMQLGEELLVSFRAPGHDVLWLDAEALVARIVQGYRAGDPGYAVGLELSYFEKSAQKELLVRLAGHPPPIPQRRPRAREPRSAAPSVIVRPVVPVWPSGIHQRFPLGVFAS
jgi:hypothetical protein